MPFAVTVDHRLVWACYLPVPDKTVRACYHKSHGKFVNALDGLALKP